LFRSINPAPARNRANYTFPTKGKKKTRLTLTSATYDPVARTATITVAPFSQTLFKELEITVSGKKNGIRDTAGNLLDGDANGKPGGDAVVTFRVFSGTSITFTDRDGDQATLRIADGGRLDGITPIKAPKTQR